MAAQTQSTGERTLRRVASSYRKQGYRVTSPPPTDALPPFLHDCQPDLIAEREDDHVVVEVKPAGSLKGANDLVELAERVAAQPGWRLELVTFKDKDPDAAVISPQWLQQILEPTNEALTCAYRIEVVGFLLRAIALRMRLRVRDKSAVGLAHELASTAISTRPSYNGSMTPSAGRPTCSAANSRRHPLRNKPANLKDFAANSSRKPRPKRTE
jgi:hypothetical protein